MSSAWPQGLENLPRPNSYKYYLIIYHPRGGIPQTRNFRGHDQMLLFPSWRNLVYTWADSMAHTKMSQVTKVPLLPYVIVYMNTPTNTQEERRI